MCSTRTWELTWESFNRHLIIPQKCDLALSIGIDSTYNRNNPFYQNAKYRFLYPEFKDVGSAFDATCDMLEIKSDWRKLLQVGDIWLGGVLDRQHQQLSGSAIPIFYRWWLHRNILMHDLIKEYDWFIISRSDHYFEFDHVDIARLDPNLIHMPMGEDYTGFQDRHVVVSSRYVLKVLDLLTHILKEPNWFYDRMINTQPYNIEKFQKLVFDRLGISDLVSRFERSMYLVKGERDSSRWSHGLFEKRCNMLIKYQAEFEMAYANKLRRSASGQLRPV